MTEFQPRRAMWSGRCGRRAIPHRLSRFTELESLMAIDALSDSTVQLEFARAVARHAPMICRMSLPTSHRPAHLLDSIPHARMRQAQWNNQPVGNGPFRFVTHEANRRWVFARNADFPEDMGGAPHVDR